MIKITKQPTSLTVREGTNATFRVYAEYVKEPDDTSEETPALTFQWYFSTDGGFIYSPSSPDGGQGVYPNIDGKSGSTLVIRNVPPGLNCAIIKCTISDGTEEIDTNGVSLIVFSNEDITSNFKMDYTSLFTGEEIDEGLRKMLGDTYDQYTIPGTRLIGRYYDEPANLNDLTVPGVYTAHFFLNGPKDLQVNNGNTPIQISVFTAEDYQYSGVTSMFQTIVTLAYATEDMDDVGISEGSALLYLYYRDILNPDTDITGDGAGWEKLLLSNGQMKVVNNLSSDNPNAVLSANMGRYLKKLIDEDSVGANNVLMASGRKQNYHNPSTFMNVWKQRIRESATSDVIDSTTTGTQLFEFNGSSISGKLENFTEESPFDSKKYFRGYLNDDYFTIDTSNSHGMDAYHNELFSESGTYAYVTKDEYDEEILPTDEAFTASMWVKLLSEASDENTSSIFIQLWLCTTEYIDGKEVHSEVPVEMIQINEQGFETYEDSDDTISRTVSTKVATDLRTKRGNFPANKWVRVSATIDGVKSVYFQGREGTVGYNADGTPTSEVFTFNTTHVKVAFGIKGTATAQFKNIKLERGKVATDGSTTLAEMWNEFDNANFIRTVPIDNEVRMDTLTEKEGLVFTLEDKLEHSRGKWIRRRLATGGGGGFVVQAYPPDEKEVLWYVYPTQADFDSEDNTLYDGAFRRDWAVSLRDNGYISVPTSSNQNTICYQGAFYFYDATGAYGAGWYPAESNYDVGDNPPANIGKLWLDTNNGKYNEKESPDLKYYDTNYHKWRIVGAEPRPAWVIQDTPPEAPDDDLMWITTSGIASVPYRRPDGVTIWLPIQAIWGNND